MVKIRYPRGLARRLYHANQIPQPNFGQVRAWLTHNYSADIGLDAAGTVWELSFVHERDATAFILQYG